MHKPWPPEERFWAFVEVVGDCWEWRGNASPRGYGQFGRGGRTEGKAMAHRWSYERYVGPITDGLYVCHACDNPPCVRPDHLFLGTQLDNIRDMITKGRRVIGVSNPPRGEASPKAKLTEAQVCQIRARYESGNETQAALSASFGVAPTQISKIIRGTRWNTGDLAIAESRRWARKGRAAGENNSRAKLTRAQVLEIRAIAPGSESQREIASRFGVALITISRIRRGVAWAKGLFEDAGEYATGSSGAWQVAAGARGIGSGWAS